VAQLPPDARRLRAILAFLDEQIAGNETVGIYLRLQRDAVRTALARTDERPAPRRRSSAGPAFARARGFVVQQKRTPNGPEPAVIHMSECTMAEGTPHPIGAHEARAALIDPNIEPCTFCRPDSELGMLD
jgi:hypothetical protein